MMESSVLVEYRPLLRSCQFFVKRSFDPASTVVTVTENNEIVIQNATGMLKLQMPESVSLEPDTLSNGVNFMPQLLHFRVRTKPPAGAGSFKTEVILTGSDSNGNGKTPLETYVPQLDLDSPVSLSCRSCGNSLATDLVFSRVLPLPNNEDADFFCHAHSDSTLTIDPRTRDIFYGLHFFRLHRDAFSCPNGVIRCEKCSAWLGLKSSKHVQLFNATVEFERSGSASCSAIDDFLAIVQVLSQSNAFMNKVVLHCDVDDHTRKYLLLWIFDRDLSLFSTVSEPPQQLLPDGEQFVRMKEQKVVKILYSLQLGSTDFVTQWLTSDSVSSVPVALPVLEKGFAHLQKMTEAIPAEFSKAYDMSLSYVVKQDK